MRTERTERTENLRSLYEKAFDAIGKGVESFSPVWKRGKSAP